MNFWFVISLIKKRNDVTDIAWGMGFVLLSWSAYYILGKVNYLGVIVNFLVTVWGLRLSWHIYSRNKNKTEDKRYLQWRKNWGKWFLLKSYLQIYLLQGLLLFVIIQPVLFVNINNVSRISLLTFVGIIIWIFGFIFEAISDHQLKKFISLPKNKGKILQSGLWKFSRHPNYFGEVTQWWGIFVIALSSENGWRTIIGPLTVTYLILFVSGIPLLEKKYQGRPEFDEYKKRTSIFIPLPPKAI